MKVLILGGYGVFGGRLAGLLSNVPALELLIAGRSLDKAQAFCRAYQGQAKVRPVQLDRKDISKYLDADRPHLLVDASGPFQDYGDARYSVIEACLKHRVNYLDFADAADFVFGVPRFDAAAKEAGVFVLSGVSSFPVLTAAVLREMAKNMEIHSVKGGIAPSPYAGVGLNVMRAVVGYAGAPVKLTRAGQPTTAPGLAESMRYTVAVPGHVPLRNIHFSLVDVPDLQVIPPAHPSLRDIWMGAGPVPEVLHRVLNLLAKVRARFALPSYTPLAPLFYRVLNLMKFGEHRGGMFVQAIGVKDGAKAERSWHLLAESDDGPYIPSMAIEALIRKMLVDDTPAIGARSAMDALELSDYAKLFESREIFTAFRAVAPPDAPLYRQVLGDAFEELPDQIRALHDDAKPRCWSGTASVKRGNSLLSNLVARLFDFPQEADEVAVTVRFEPFEGGEHWQRDFGAHSFSSVQSLGKGRNEHLVVERFGPISVALALVIKDEKLFLVPRSWSAFGIPLPRRLLPNGTSFEEEQEGCFHFNVEIAAPIVGRIVAYEGRLSKRC